MRGIWADRYDFYVKRGHDGEVHIPGKLCGIHGKFWESKKEKSSRKLASFLSNLLHNALRSMPKLRRVKLLAKMINKKEE